MVSLPCITKEKWIIRIKHHILLPLLQDETHSVATIKHALQKIRETVRFLNPGQIPVVTADQPLYSLAKQIQQKIGQSTKRIRLSCEMAALKSIGTLLHDSGWTSALVEASIASSFTAEAYLSASSVTRTRQAHQGTACHSRVSLQTLLPAVFPLLATNPNQFFLFSFLNTLFCCSDLKHHLFS